jgi:uncharacterized coiled-coil DUF342 family protein
MKRIMNYNSFLEDKKEDNFPEEEYIKNFGFHPPKDQADAAKKLSDFNNDLQKFNSLKSRIDDIYLKSKDGDEIKAKIENLLGKRDDVKRNPFLIKYQDISALRKEVSDMKTDITKDQMSLKDYGSMKDANDNATQVANIDDKITDLNTTIKGKEDKVKDLNDQINTGYTELKKFIDDMRKDMNKWIKNVQSA